MKALLAAKRSPMRGGKAKCADTGWQNFKIVGISV